MTARSAKALRDLLRRPGRSWLTVVAMAAGIFQIAVMLTAYALLRPELAGMHARTNPSSATLDLDHGDSAAVAVTLGVDGVAKAELRPVIVARTRAEGDDWVPAMVHVVGSFENQQLDLFNRQAGAWPPGPGDVLLERTALQVARVRVGDTLTFRSGDGADVRLRVAGTVHAPGMAPAWMEHMVPAFVGPDSWLRGRESGETVQLRFVADHPLDEGFIRETADSVRAALVREGHAVGRVLVPLPGRHPHAAQMEAFLFLLLAFGLSSFALSAVLVTSVVRAMMAEQLREVGIMKAVGGTSAQIAWISLAQVGLLAACALAVGLPAGMWAGRAYAGFSAGILNTDVSSSPFPFEVPLVVALLAVAVPLLVALGPVRRAARITVAECMNDAPAPGRVHSLDRAISLFRGLPRPLALLLRGTFARRGQLALGLALFSISGAVFMAALNVGEDWRRSVREDFARRPYDLMLVFEDRLAVAQVREILAEVPAVTASEFWPGNSPWLLGPSGVASVTTAFVGPDPGSAMFRPRVIEGRGWANGAADGVLVNQVVAKLAGGVHAGDSVRVRMRGRTLAFRVAGIVRELAPMPVIYAGREVVLEATRQSPDSTRNVRVALRAHSDADQREAVRAIESECERRGIALGHAQRMEDAKQGILDHLVIILSILTLASAVVVFVGSLALTTTLTLGVVQRTREFAVMKAIGATPAVLARMVWFEGLLLGVAGWALASLLTVPITVALEHACGRIFFQAPLDPYVWPAANAIWLALVLVLSSLGSFVPARRAARLAVREAFARD